MINNQTGRPPPRPWGPKASEHGGQPGNRQDNRQRGNAAQLLEKYKNMARDAQLAGDRVQSEYYLQFADHYYRMLGESRARYRRAAPPAWRRCRTTMATTNVDDATTATSSSNEQQQQQRSSAEPRAFAKPANRASDRDRRPRRDNRNNGARPESDNDDDERISFEVLPPAIGSQRRR